MNPLGPYPLSHRATFRLLHFSHRGDNLLRVLLGIPPQKLPAYVTLNNTVTGRQCMIPTNPEFEDTAIAIIEQMAAEAEAAKNG